MPTKPEVEPISFLRTCVRSSQQEIVYGNQNGKSIDGSAPKKRMRKSKQQSEQMKQMYLHRLQRKLYSGPRLLTRPTQSTGALPRITVHPHLRHSARVGHLQSPQGPALSIHLLIRTALQATEGLRNIVAFAQGPGIAGRSPDPGLYGMSRGGYPV